jgi:antitoxin (DNA-binding transcriptional repressor) of toxin-antitoxin stability system
MSAKVLTVTEVIRNFSEYINRVAYRNEAFVLRKGKKSVAELRPLPHGRRLGDLPSILRSVPHLSRADAASFASDVDTARTDLDATMPRDPWACC